MICICLFSFFFSAEIMSALTQKACNQYIYLKIGTFAVNTIVYIIVLYITFQTSFQLYTSKSSEISPLIFKITIVFLAFVSISMSINTSRIIWSWISLDNCQFLYENNAFWKILTWLANVLYALHFPALLALLYIRLTTIFDETMFELTKYWKRFYISCVVIISVGNIGTVIFWFDLWIALQWGGMIIICSSVVFITIFIHFVVKLNHLSEIANMEVKEKLEHLIVKSMYIYV